MQKEKRQWADIGTKRCPLIVPTMGNRRRGTYEVHRGWQQRDEGNRRYDTNYENTGSFNAEVVKEIRNNQVEVNVSENGKVE